MGTCITPLPLDFYLHDGVVSLAKDLLGKWLVTNIDGELTGGKIIETEAYRGAEDRASHAFNNRPTKRTEVIFQAGGIAYVYLCYGIHNLFNVVTNIAGIPHAILIRAIDPTIGLETMKKRRQTDKNLTGGPGTVCQALGIDRSHNGVDLTQSLIWIEDRGTLVLEEKIVTTARIGVDYAKEDATLPWRFLLENE